MNEIKPEWILEFFNKDYAAIDAWVQEGATIESMYIDGAFSPRDMAKFLTKKMADEIREPGEDWLPTAENINSLPKGMKSFVCNLETLCDPQYVIRENIIMKDLIRQLEAKIL